MKTSRLPPDYVEAAPRFGCSLEEMLELYVRGVTVITTAFWRNMNLQPSALCNLIDQGYTVDDIFAVAHVTQMMSPRLAAMQACLDMGLRAESAREYGERTPRHERTLEEIAAYLNPDLPPEYAASLI